MKILHEAVDHRARRIGAERSDGVESDTLIEIIDEGQEVFIKSEPGFAEAPNRRLPGVHPRRSADTLQCV